MNEAEGFDGLRASDAERDRAAEFLREAMTSGRLNVEELDERLRLTFAAKTRPELERLVNDVLVPHADLHPLATPASVTAIDRLPVRHGENGARKILSILGASERKGRWRLGPVCSVVTVLGGSELDLSGAELAAEHVELKLFTVLGGAEVTVPPGLNVEISELAILGGNEIDLGDERPDPGGPTVHLRIVSILGGAEVRRGPKLTRKERKELRHRERELADLNQDASSPGA